MQDFLLRGMTKDGYIKVSAVQTTHMVETMRNLHKTLPLATAALGRTLTAASMMGEQLKQENGSVTIQIRGGGPLGAITAVADAQGNARGYLQNPAVVLPLKPNGKLDVSAGVGTDGILTVIKDIGERQPFSGKVELLSGEIAEDIAGYFVLSEQVPTVCALGVLVDVDQSVKCAGGYLIQLMPGAPVSLIETLEQRVAESGSITAHLERGETVDVVMAQILREMGFELVDRHAVQYECKCSRQRVERALISMGKKELEELARGDKPVEVTCQFCDKVYGFTRDELLKMADQKNAKKVE